MRKTSKFLDIVESRLSLIWMLLGDVGLTIVVAFGMTAFEWFVTGGIKIWVLVLVPSFLFFFALSIFIAYLFEKRKISSFQAEEAEIRAGKTSKINLAKGSYEDQTYTFDDLFFPFHSEIKGKTFRNCIFMGGGAVAFQGHSSHFECNFNNPTIVAFKPPKIIYGAVAFVDCQFVGCKFFNLIFIIDNGPALQAFRGVGGHDHLEMSVIVET